MTDQTIIWILFTASVALAALALIINARNGRLRKKLDNQTVDIKWAAREIERVESLRARLGDQNRELRDYIEAYKQTQAADRESLAHKAKILEEKNMEIVAAKKEICLLRRALMREAPRTRTFMNDDEKYREYLGSIAAIKPRKRPYLSDKQAVEIGKKAQREVRDLGLISGEEFAEWQERGRKNAIAEAARRGLSSMVSGKETREGAV